MSPRLKIVAALGVWVALMAGALGALANYSGQPGRAGAAPDSWPADSRIAAAPDRATVVMLAHPRCSCTHASLSELERLIATTGDRARFVVLFVRPEGVAEGWDDTGLVARARDIDGVDVVIDRDGREAARFGVTTSGHLVVFDRDGKRLFSGGITAARGHEGDNAGSAAVRVLLTTGERHVEGTPTFGCDLLGEKAKR